MSFPIHIFWAGDKNSIGYKLKHLATERSKYENFITIIN